MQGMRRQAHASNANKMNLHQPRAASIMLLALSNSNVKIAMGNWNNSNKLGLSTTRGKVAMCNCKNLGLSKQGVTM